MEAEMKKESEISESVVLVVKAKGFGTLFDELAYDDGKRKKGLFIINCKGFDTVESTDFLKNIEEQSDIILGKNVVYAAPTPSLKSTFEMCVPHKSSAKVPEMTFNVSSVPASAEKSEFNPLFGLTPEAAATALISSFPKSKEPNYSTLSWIIINAIIHSIKRKDVSIHDIVEYLSVFRLSELKLLLIDCYKTMKDSDDVATSKAAAKLLDFVHKREKIDSSYINKVAITLGSELQILTSGEVGSLIGNAKTNPIAEKIASGEVGTIFVNVDLSNVSQEIRNRTIRLMYASLSCLTSLHIQNRSSKPSSL